MIDAVGQTGALAFEKFGVRLSFSASDEDLLALLTRLVPPDAEPCEVESAPTRFTLEAEPGLGYRVLLGEAGGETCAGLDLALAMLDIAVRGHLAANATGVVFVRAGVVIDRGAAIVLPGASFTGKTTLVQTLVGAGAEYYSDEYAVLDGDGAVMPYRTRPTGPGLPADEDIRGAKRVAIVASVPYAPGAHWHVEQRTAGEGMLALLQSAVTVAVRPAETMHAARHAAAGAHVIIGRRGDSGQAAAELLELSAQLNA